MQNKQRGFFAIGIDGVKFNQNIGMLFRAAHAFGASYIFTIGHRYKTNQTDTTKASRHIPLMAFNSAEHFKSCIPRETTIVLIQYDSKQSRSIHNFIHPERAIYILGSEDYGISTDVKQLGNTSIYIPTEQCLNVAMAGNIVLYDRQHKNIKKD